MLRKLTAAFEKKISNPTKKTEDQKSILTTNQRIELTAKIDDFVKNIKRLKFWGTDITYGTNITVIQCNYPHVHISFKPIDFIKMKLNYVLGVKTYEACQNENEELRQLLSKSKEYKKWYEPSNPFYPTYETNRMNEVIDCFARFVSKGLDTPAHIAFLMCHLRIGAAPSVLTLLNTIESTPSASMEDVAFFTQIHTGKYEAPLVTELYSAVLQKLIVLREHKFDIPQYRNLLKTIVEKLPYFKPEEFKEFENLDIIFIIKKIESLPIDKRANALTYFVRHDIFDFLELELYRNGFNKPEDKVFALERFVKHIRPDIGGGLLALRAANLDTPKNREALFNAGENKFGDAWGYKRALNELSSAGFFNDYHKQDYFQRIISFTEIQANDLGGVIEMFNAVSLATPKLCLEFLEKPEYNEILSRLSRRLAHESAVLNKKNILTLLDNKELLPIIYEKLDHYSYYSLTQAIFDQIILEVTKPALDPKSLLSSVSMFASQATLPKPMKETERQQSFSITHPIDH